MAYVHNGNVWLRRADGLERVLPTAGLLGSGRRVVQFLGPNRAALLLNGPFGSTMPECVDLQRVWDAADPQPAVGRVSEGTCGDLEQFLGKALGVDQGSMRVVANDLCGSRTGKRLAVSGVVTRGTRVLPDGWVVVVDLATGRPVLAPGSSANTADSTPFWLRADEVLLFDRVDLATGARRTMLWDLTAATSTEVRIQRREETNPRNTWLLDACEAAGLLAVGVAEEPSSTAPDSLVVADSAGVTHWTGGSANGPLAAAFSANGTRLAYILSAGHNNAEPFDSTLTDRQLWMLDVALGRLDLLLSPDAPDRVRDDPNTPYQLCW